MPLFSAAGVRVSSMYGQCAGRVEGFVGQLCVAKINRIENIIPAGWSAAAAPEGVVAPPLERSTRPASGAAAAIEKPQSKKTGHPGNVSNHVQKEAST